MSPLDFTNVPVEICDEGPKVSKHLGLVSKVLSYLVRLRQNVSVLLRQETGIVFTSHQFLEAVNQLKLLCDFVLF